MRLIARSAPLAIALLLGGCINREIKVNTNPPGALVWLNDQEVGRTPLSKSFTWYGNYDVVIRADGYQTLKLVAAVNPPVWQFIPFDLITDLLPLHHEQTLNYFLQPLPPAAPDAVLARGEQLQTQLVSSTTTKPTRTFAATKMKKPTTRPATRPRL